MSSDKTIGIWSSYVPEPEKKVLWPGWETVRIIGQGNFGTVYEIQRDVLGSTESAALKVITIPKNDRDLEEMYYEGYDQESLTETFREHMQSIAGEYSLVRKLADCHHIVRSEDIRYIQHENGIGWDIFIKMELLTPLMQVLPEKIPEQMVCRIAADICKALVVCKKHGIVHRDIKPQNIFVSANGAYKLGDFGIAKTVEKTMGGTLAGTFRFMAPEVACYKPYGHSADICSLGLVLYWLLNERRLPFLPLPPVNVNSTMDEDARKRRLQGESLPPPAHGSKELKRIVLKACAFDPKDRYATAEQMLQDVEVLLSSKVTDVDSKSKNGEKAGSKKKKVLLCASAVTVAIALTVGLLCGKRPEVSGNEKPNLSETHSHSDSEIQNDTGKEIDDHGWQMIEGNRYYFDAQGQKLTGTQIINGFTYYFNAEGVQQIGWQTIDGQDYYYGEDGMPMTGTQEIEGILYCFDDKGVKRITLVKPPEDCTVAMDEKTDVTIEAVGAGLTYEWWAMDVMDTIYYKSTTFLSTFYKTKMNEERDGRKIYCKITDKYGNVLETKPVVIRMK